MLKLLAMVAAVAEVSFAELSAGAFATAGGCVLGGFVGCTAADLPDATLLVLVLAPNEPQGRTVVRFTAEGFTAAVGRLSSAALMGFKACIGGCAISGGPPSIGSRIAGSDGKGSSGGCLLVLFAELLAVLFRS